MLHTIFLFIAISFAKTPLVISLDPSATELIYDLDLNAKVIAKDAASNYPDKAKSLDIVSRHLQPDKEGIVKRKPDWIIAHDIGFQSLKKNFEPWGISVMLLSNKHLSDYFENAEKLLKEFSSQTSLSDLKQKTSLGVTKKINKKYIMIVEEQTKIAVGKNSFIHEALEKCGLKNQVGQMGYPKLSREFLKTTAVDYLFVLKPQDKDIKKIAANTYHLNADIYSRLSLRFFKGIRKLCGVLSE